VFHSIPPSGTNREGVRIVSIYQGKENPALNDAFQKKGSEKKKKAWNETARRRGKSTYALTTPKRQRKKKRRSCVGGQGGKKRGERDQGLFNNRVPPSAKEKGGGEGRTLPPREDWGRGGCSGPRERVPGKNTSRKKGGGEGSRCALRAFKGGDKHSRGEGGKGQGVSSSPRGGKKERGRSFERGDELQGRENLASPGKNRNKTKSP